MWGTPMGKGLLAPSASPILYPNADDSAEGLIEQVKNLQKNDKAAKEQWDAFTDLEGKGVRDPKRHTAEFLQNFLTHLSSGGRLAPSPEADLTQAIKTLQKKCTPFKNVWAQFCAMNGGGMNDPAKHDGTFHMKFFEALCQGAGGGGMGPMPMAGGGDNPMKRMKTASGMSMGTSFGGGGQKEALVNRLKAFQRSGNEQKELWATYADQFLGGVRDPSRHDAPTLEEFCANHGVPEVGGGGPMGGGGAMSGGLDPELASLVARVKAYQKSGPEGHQHWADFAGEKRDPAKKTAEELNQFCTMYGI